MEEYKIKSFIRMMKGMKTVGLAYTSPEEYEYWSLIKAYAIEGQFTLLIMRVDHFL